ncbi:MAG TPA: E3 binding domain-containing protein [Phycisphaerae bacterium]|nr:E3 binding domain-containing protein [Phycisphaerae bacterium]
MASKGQRLNPDPDAPEHFYDYRKAMRAGAEPTLTEHGDYRWPDLGKLPGHPVPPEIPPAPNPRAVLDRLRVEQGAAAPTGRDLMAAPALNPPRFFWESERPESKLPPAEPRKVTVGEAVEEMRSGRAASYYKDASGQYVPAGEEPWYVRAPMALASGMASIPAIVPGLYAKTGLPGAEAVGEYVAKPLAAIGGAEPSVFREGAGALATPEWWSGVAGGLAGYGVFAAPAVGKLIPKGAGLLRQMAATVPAFGALGGLEAAARPETTGRDIMLGAATGAAAGAVLPPVGKAVGYVFRRGAARLAKIGAPKAALKAREGYVRAWVAEQAGKGPAAATKNAEHRYISALRRLPAEQHGTHLQQAKSMAMARILEAAPAGAVRGPTEIKFGRALEAGGMWGFESKQIADLKTQLDAALQQARAQGKEPVLRRMSAETWATLKRQWQKSAEAFREFWSGKLPADPAKRAVTLNFRLQAATAGAQYRTAPAGGTEAEYLSFLAPETVAKAPAGAGMKLYGGVPADPAEFIRLAQTVGDISQPVAVRILESLGKHGGSVVRATVAALVAQGMPREAAEGVARNLAEAFAKPAPPAAAEAMVGKPAEAAPAPTKAAEIQARKLGIDLAAVRGTGRKGQILRKDVADAAKIRTIREKSERVGAPLRPGTVLEQTRQALEDEGLPTRAETPGVPQERRTPAGEADKEGEIAPARGRQAAPRPQKPPITAAGRVPLAPTRLASKRAGAEQPPAGEEVPFEILAKGAPRAAPTVQAFDRMEAPELVRMLGKVSGPYGGSVAETKEVGQAVKALRQEIKNDKVGEAADRKYLEQMQAAYPDISAGGEGVGEEGGGLLGLLGDARIIYGKGVELGVEIEEAVVGLPKALRRHFIHVKYANVKGGAGAMTIEALNHYWMTRTDTPAADAPSLSETFDNLMREIKAYEAAKAEGAISTEDALRKLARAVPEEVGEELVERADKSAARKAAIDAAREKVLAAAEPYLAVEREALEIEGTASEREAAEKLAVAEREIAAARQTINQLKILQGKAQERPVEIEALRKVFVSIAERMLPLEERGKLLARVRTLKTVVEFTHALEQAEKYLEQTIKLRILARYQHYAGLLERHKRKIEPEILAFAKKALAARPSGGRYTELELDTLDELADTVEQTWHWHQTSENLLGLGQYIQRTETAEKILAEATAGREPMARQVGVGGQPVAPDIGKVHWFGREGIQSLDTMIEGPALGAVPDGPLYRHFVSLVGIEASEPYYRHVNAGLDHLDEAIERELGMKRDSLEFQDWVLEPLTFDLPTLGKLTGPRGYWGALRNTLTDPDSLAEMVTEAWSGLVWESDLRMPKLRPTTRDADAFLAQWAEREPQADEVAKAAKQYINRKEHFKALSEKNHEIFGLYFPPSTGQYWGRRRNVKTEGRLDLPGWLGGEGDLLISQPGRYKARTGSKASLIIGSFIDQYMSSLYEDAAFLAYGTPVQNALKLLKAPLEHGDRRMTLEAWLQEYHGTSFGNALRGQLRHIMESRRLSPVRYGEGPPTGAARKVLGATRRAVLMSPWPWVSQLPSGLAAASDTLRPVTLGSTLSGMRRSLLSGEFSGLRDLLESRSATLRWRWHEARAESIIGTQTEAGSISHKKGWRRVQRTVRSILKPLMHFDCKAIVGDFAGAIEDQLAARSIPIRGRLLDVLNGLPEAQKEEIIKAAVDHVHWLVPRTQPNLDPAYDSGIKREAKKSLFWTVLTYFTNFRNRMVNMAIRLAHEYRRTGNLKKLLAGLVPLFMITLAYTLKGKTQRAISGGKTPLGGIGGDLAENALGNLYGAGEVAHALRARSGYAARLRGIPAASAITDVLGGLVEMRRMITDGPKVRGPAAWRATKGLVRGTGMMLGLPTPILFSLIRSMGRIGEGEPAEEKKADLESLAWKASGEGAGAAAAVEKLKVAGMTFTQARLALRAAMQARGDRSAKAWFERSRALRKAWYGTDGAVPAGERQAGLSRSRARGGLPVLGQSGASFGAAGVENRRLGGFRGETAPAFPGRTGRGGALTRA